MFYTSAWCLKGEERFKENIPLIAFGDSLLRFRSKERLTVLLLEGFEYLSQSYIRELSERNIDVVDFAKEFIGIINAYPNINKHYSHYERNCFLRWIAFKNYREKHDTAQFWHFDSDLALYISSEELIEKTRGLTFMTLGCPCFLTVSQESWFQVYENELSQLNENIEGYLIQGGITREQCKANDHRTFNVSLYREPLGSDQDFLEYLISSEKLFQEGVDDITRGGLYYIQNPLSFFQMDSYLSDRSSAKVSSNSEGHLLYKSRKIPFIHYQSGFYYFSAVAARFFHEQRFLTRLLLKYNITENTWESSAFGQYLWKIFREAMPKSLNRNNMTNFLSSQDNDGEMRIAGLLNTFINIFGEHK
jgi:hypothetical protein